MLFKATRSFVTAAAAVVAVTAFVPLAEARDSTWLLCKGAGEHGTGANKEKTRFVANIHEHRNPKGGDDREISVTLIYGAHVNVGDALTDKKAALKLTNVHTNKVVYTGNGVLSSDMKSFQLTGKLDFTFGDDPKAPQDAFTAKLTCEELDDKP